MIIGGIGERRLQAIQRNRQDCDGWLYAIHAAGAAVMVAVVWLAGHHPWH